MAFVCDGCTDDGCDACMGDGLCDTCGGDGCDRCDTPSYVSCTCYVRFYNYSGSSLLAARTEDRSLLPGYTYTPSSHMPDYDSGTYSLYSITYNGSDYTTGSFTCPSSSFSLYYNFRENTPSVEQWSWSSSNGNASSKLTSDAYSAITNKTSVNGFSYLVWNDLCAKTLEAIHTNGEYWNTTYAAYETTLMTSDENNHVLTAKRFNSLRYNIGLHASTGIKEVAKGDIVRGSYFITLASSLNDFIRKL